MHPIILLCLLAICLKRSQEQCNNSSLLIQHEGEVVLEINANKTLYAQVSVHKCFKAP